ncbi:MAG: formimidoylglutamase [Flavobacteriales bacterium]|nr:formimidoylglutamase [Flavobacteriales bacterium]
MMEGILDFFEPTDIDFIPSENGVRKMGDSIRIHSRNSMPSPIGTRIAIIGVKEERGTPDNEGCENGADAVRKYFYELTDIDTPLEIIDLGNILAGDRIADTYAALRTTCRELIAGNVIPVIIGGGHDLTYGNYAAYESLEQTVNLVTVDSRLDFGGDPNHMMADNFLNQIVMHQPNYLFNYSNIGHQRYLTDKDVVDLMDKMFFDLHRLGEVNGKISDAEPVLRNADIVSIDMSAIRGSDSPGSAGAGPNGFYAEDMCQLCRYAGMSDKLTSFGIYEYNPFMDPRGFSAHLVAQMIWHFIEGVTLRKGDYPIANKETYVRYIVPMSDHELVFYKSPLTDRWWMDVPYVSGSSTKYQRHHLVPCTYEDYQSATNEEMPDRWWKTFQKLG